MLVVADSANVYAVTERVNSRVLRPTMVILDKFFKAGDLTGIDKLNNIQEKYAQKQQNTKRNPVLLL